jgi:hypothetical protein
MEQHVPTLETCQRLKDAGFPQQTEFYWRNLDDRWSIFNCIDDDEPEGCAAPILTEILAQLPGNSDAHQIGTFRLSINDRVPGEIPRYVVLYDYTTLQQNDDNAAEAAARIYLQLKEDLWIHQAH